MPEIIRKVDEMVGKFYSDKLIKKIKSSRHKAKSVTLTREPI